MDLHHGNGLNNQSGKSNTNALNTETHNQPFRSKLFILRSLRNPCSYDISSHHRSNLITHRRFPCPILWNRQRMVGTRTILRLTHLLFYRIHRRIIVAQILKQHKSPTFMVGLLIGTPIGNRTLIRGTGIPYSIH